MSFINFLEKIQTKPRYIRMQILCAAVFIIMFCLVSWWVISLKSSFSSISESGDQQIEQIKEEMPSIRESFKASIGSFFEKTNEIFKEAEEEIIEEETTKTEELKPLKLPLPN
jgi:hypothetical protein